MKEIYVLTKSYEVNDEPQYKNEPSTFALTKEEAREQLENTLAYWKRIRPDLEVLALDDLHLHVRYYTEDGETEHDEVIWVTRVFHGTWVW
jgi:hypothetical protein